MGTSRLEDALAEAGGWPASGRILVLRPTLASDLGCVPRDRALIVTGFRPDFDSFRERGWAVAEAPEGAFSGALIFLPRARALARALVHQSAGLLPEGAPIWIDGQKHDGIESALKDIRSRQPLLAQASKAHGRAFGFANPGAAVFDGWQGQAQEAAPGFITRPGVFSADGIDPGSALLARHLPADLRGKGADLGAGWGWLAAQVLARPGVKTLHLVEAEAEALASARDNVTDARAAFHWADATRFRPPALLDFVVTNPPFHVSRAADPGLGAAFIEAARTMLAPSGQLWLVANRTLPYEEAMAQAFLEVRQVASEGGFKVLMGAKPRFKRR
ncbi:methyltransferase [Frigidibacter sp. RF13]|uniref:methyltransferase n=1 Tax=Frigidibacter sp. RF13 TaxID=2997340 RepID=UPI00227181EB|nr:methyltransferase [Frigidibacter sp. RF13]MCY1126483.1 methyltransferase [Frigidibacter sp. RF13]